MFFKTMDFAWRMACLVVFVGLPSIAQGADDAQVARGKYLAFLDADDLWLPGKLVAQVSHLERNPEVGMVYSAWQEWYPEANGQFVAPAMDKINGDADALETQSSGWLYNALLLDCIIHTTTVVMRSNVAREVGDFDKALKRGQDYDYWLRVSRLTPIHKLRGVYSLYRVHPERHADRFFSVLNLGTGKFFC